MKTREQNNETNKAAMGAGFNREVAMTQTQIDRNYLRRLQADLRFFLQYDRDHWKIPVLREMIAKEKEMQVRGL